MSRAKSPGGILHSNHLGSKILFSSIVVLLSAAPGWSRDKIILSEEQITKMSREETPEIMKVQAGSESAKAKEAQLRYKYDAQGFTSYSYSDTNEKAQTSYEPQIGPIKNLSIGIRKNLPIGVGVSVNGFSRQISAVNGAFQSATRVGGRVQMDIDLWTNIFGQLDSASLKSGRLKQKQSELQAQINKTSFEFEIRKLYWAIVANKKATELASRMVGTAEIQVRDLQRRFKAGDADSGDLARSQSQLTARKSVVSILLFSKEQLLYRLKRALPQLSNYDVEVAEPDFEQFISNTLACVRDISSTELPQITKYSFYSEVLSLINQAYGFDRTTVGAENKMDFKLQLQEQTSAVADNHADAFDEAKGFHRDGFVVGVMLTVPLGGSGREARDHSLAALRYNYESDKRGIEQNLIENHVQIIQSLKLLEDAVASQDASLKALNLSLKSVTRKYKQARTTINALVLEQDALFNSSLQEIDTKLTVVNTLYDFFKVYSSFPCKINQLSQASVMNQDGVKL